MLLLLPWLPCAVLHLINLIGPKILVIDLLVVVPLPSPSHPATHPHTQLNWISCLLFFFFFKKMYFHSVLDLTFLLTTMLYFNYFLYISLLFCFSFILALCLSFLSHLPPSIIHGAKCLFTVFWEKGSVVYNQLYPVTKTTSVYLRFSIYQIRIIAISTPLGCDDWMKCYTCTDFQTMKHSLFLKKISNQSSILDYSP